MSKLKFVSQTIDILRDDGHPIGEIRKVYSTGRYVLDFYTMISHPTPEEMTQALEYIDLLNSRSQK